MKKLTFRGVLALFVFCLNIFSQWEQCSGGMNSGSVFSLLSSGNTIFAGTSSGIYKSLNNGTSWVQTSLNSNSVNSIVTNGAFIFAAVTGNGVYRSSDNGSTWSLSFDNNGSIKFLAADGTDIYSADESYVYRSADNGLNWQLVFTSVYPVIGSLASNGSTFFIGEQGVSISANSGISWIQTLNTYPYIVNSMISGGGNVYAGALGVFRSTDGGSSWGTAALTNNYIRAMEDYNGCLFAGTNNNGVFVSNDNGTTWTAKNAGFGVTPPIIRSFCISGGYILAGTWLQNVYRRHIDEFIGIKPTSAGIPGNFSMAQNYPNPFNPATKIRFDIPAAGDGNMHSVQLKIFDNIGREITTLVNEQLQPGSYEIEWDAANYPSGVYYYKLLSGDYSDTKKMILVK